MTQMFREIIVDNFAGGGGASTGIELATGRHVDIAINHDPEAIAMHKTNHPTTEHYCESVWDVNPREVVNGQPTALVWLSPDCTHFSKAKGGKPVDKNIRGLAWIAVRWAATVKPRVIMLENVEEFKTWGPLVNGQPCPDRKGVTFRAFIRALERQGYTVKHKEIRAYIYGAPTIRKRFFLIARRDGQPIVWPNAVYESPKLKAVKQGKLKPYRTAADCIDWSIPCHSIFLTKEQGKNVGVRRPLATNTLKRIAKGTKKFVLDSKDPFIVKLNHTSNVSRYECFRGHSVNEPLGTITQSPGFALAYPFITEHANGSSQRNMPIDEPMRTLCAQVKGGHFATVIPFIAKHYTGVVGTSIDKPLPTVTSIDHNALVYAHLLKLRNGQYGQPVLTPVPTLTAGGGHVGVIHSYVLKYYGINIGHPCNEPLHTVTSKHRFGLVTIKSIKPPYSDDLLYQAWCCARYLEDYSETKPDITLIPYPRKRWVDVHGGVLYDIGMRMLQPRELYNAQGFPSDYIIDRDYTGKKITKTSQVARCGNAVPPPFAEHLVRANLPEMCSGGDLYSANSERAAS